MMTSPIYRGADRPLPGAAAGNDSTLVGAFLPRHCRLSERTAESSLSTIASSTARVETARAAANTADLTTFFAAGRFCQRVERTITSISTRPAAALLRGRGVVARLNPWFRPWRA